MIYRHDGPGGAIVHLSADEPRCPGKPAGPQGLQTTSECYFCVRRTYNSVGYPVMTPPEIEPCPERVEP